MAESNMEVTDSSTRELPTSEKTGGARASRGRRTYIFVPYEEIKRASELGADFDRTLKLWYVPRGADLAAFDAWREPPRPMSDADIEADLETALEDMGLVLVEPLTMDGSWQDTRVSTSKSIKALKGAYKATLVDGKANGYIKNFDTGEDRAWRPNGITMNSEERERIRKALEYNQRYSPQRPSSHVRSTSESIAAAVDLDDAAASARVQRQQALADSRRQQEEETAAQYACVAALCEKKWQSLSPALSHAYLDRKQVESFGLRLDVDKIVTPIRDADGKIWSLQYVDPKGNKLYEKGGQKAGHFHVLGDINVGKTILFGEGYATCASLHMATRLPVVEVFDGGNIGPVMDALAPRLVGRDLIVCGDDDVLTRDRIVRTVSKVITSDFAVERLKLQQIDDDEIEVDGVRRKLRGNPDCTMELRYELSPEGVQRVVGEIRNEATGKHVPVKIVNGGREKALAAAASHNAKATFPAFQSLEGGPTDFNDLHEREGLSTVRRQIGMAMLARTVAMPERTPQEVAKAVIGDGAVVSAARDNGRYVGPVVGNTSSHAVQNVGRQTAIAHDLGRLDKVPPVGKAAQIVYSNGRGQVETAEKDKSVNRER
jgi:putative DNA primase/helicase